MVEDVVDEILESGIKKGLLNHEGFVRDDLLERLNVMEKEELVELLNNIYKVMVF